MSSPTAAVSNQGLIAVTLKWLKSADEGFYEVLNSIRRICQLFGNNVVASRAEAAVNAAVVPHFFYLSLSFVQQGIHFPTENVTIKKTVEAAHQFFDFSSTSLYTWTFFSIKDCAGIFRVAAISDLFFDVTDLMSGGFTLFDLQKKSIDSQPALLQKRHENEKTSAWINLIRAIAAVATSILAASLLVLNIALAPAALALGIGLLSTSLSILGYYHKNYWCENVPK